MLASNYKQIVILLHHLYQRERVCFYANFRHHLWLYVYLLLKANTKTGRLLLDPKKTVDQLQIKEGTILSCLGHLRKQNLLIYKRYGTWLLVQLAGWERSDYSEQSEADTPTIPQVIPDEEVDAEAEDLSPEVLVEMFQNGDNITFYRRLFREYPSDLIQRAYQEVMAIPQDRIKKSRGALFTYLLKKYAQEEADKNPSH